MGTQKKPRYQDEPTELVAGILAQGHIRAWELFKIVSWKSAKGVAWLSLNSESEVELYTGEALEHLRKWSDEDDVLKDELTREDWDTWQSDVGLIIGAHQSRTTDGNATGLQRLHGVGYPVATAILALLKPKIFPVMDRWAVETIFGAGASRQRWQTKAAYRAYAERLVDPDCRALEEIETLRGRDIEVMSAAMEKRVIKGYQAINLPK